MTQAQSPDAPLLRHGGRIDAAMRAYPEAPRPWLDLSTGINPRAWTPPAGLVVDPGPLPDVASLRALEAAAAAHFGCAADRVAAVPGSEIALRLLPALGLPRPIATADGGYPTHREVADVTGGEGVTMLIANPNNPDGRVADPATLRPAGDGWLVVDEAFADATPGVGVASRIGDASRIVVLRSFGKFFGLAGLRLGFVVGPPTIVARVRELTGDWPVSAQAIAWGRAAYVDAAWIAATRVALAAAAARLDALLARHGLVATGACPLFRLVERADARAVFDRLARAGVLARPFADAPMRLRFGLPGDDAGFDRLDRALADG